MALFNSSSPAYKTAVSPNAVAYAPVAPSSGLAGLFGSLIGGTTPVYKTLDGQAARVPTSSPGLLRIFIGSAPSYKTVQPAVSDELDDGSDADDADDADDACPPPTDTVIVL